MKSTVPVVETRKVVRALKDLGFEETSRGHKHGHVFQRPDKITARPNTMHREMTHQAMFQLGNELEGKKICTRREFIAMVKTGKTHVQLAPSTLPDAVAVPEHVEAIRRRVWDPELDAHKGREVTTVPVHPMEYTPPTEEGMGTATRKRAAKVNSVSALQVNEASYEIVRISQFEVRVKAADGELDVLGQYASKKAAVQALTEFLIEQV